MTSTAATKTTKTVVGKTASNKTQLRVLVAIASAEGKRSTRIDLGVEKNGKLALPAIPTMAKMVEQGLIKVVGSVPPVKRGRPAFIYANTDKGAKRAARAIAAAAKVAETHEAPLAA